MAYSKFFFIWEINKMMNQQQMNERIKSPGLIRFMCQPPYSLLGLQLPEVGPGFILVQPWMKQGLVNCVPFPALNLKFEQDRIKPASRTVMVVWLHLWNHFGGIAIS